MAKPNGTSHSPPSKISTAGNQRRESSIQSSWQRCQDQYHLDPHRPTTPPRLSDIEVKKYKEPLDEFLIHTSPIFDHLRMVAKDAGYCILVTDANGIVVQSHFDSSIVRDLASEGLQHGSVWTESLIGTNGVGTCLESGRALTVYADEHFGESLKRFSCSAAPLIAPDGTPFGAIDVSTFAQGRKLAQGLALNLVCETADQIEAVLFRRAYAEHYLLAISAASPTYGSSFTGLLAVDGSGRISAATSTALMLLGQQQRAQIVNQSLEVLTGQTLERVVAAGSNPVLIAGKKPLTPLCLTYLIPQPQPARVDPASRSKTACLEEIADSPLLQVAGSEEALQQKALICHRVLDRDITILLQGETGTGKEVWAHAIHQSSARCDKPFVTLNCAAIPESLIESELFGYGSGTFTGGLKGGKIGKIQASEGGTLFLDEIGDMPLELQARLLRVLAEREITPLGQVQPVKIDLHVICATHRNLKDYVTQGKFREDLYYRISGVNIPLPALRDRQDKQALFSKLIDLINHEEGVERSITLAQPAQNLLLAYHWPGNIRQLKNVLQLALCMCDGVQIRIDDLPEELRAQSNALDGHPAVPSRVASLPHNIPLATSPATSEKELILQTLIEHRWVVTRAAKAMGVSRSTMHRKIKLHALQLPDDECP
ncbi:MAG: sigma-54-dependent Fis family transcriptional regulator [Halopseudomonas sp.]